MNRRKHKRVPFEVMATVGSDRISVSGMVCDLSMNGMFLTTAETLGGQGPLEISIFLSGSSSLLSIKLKGRAVRRTVAGIGIEFQEMDLDCFTHLRNIVAQNSEDPDAVFREYQESIVSRLQH